MTAVTARRAPSTNARSIPTFRPAPGPARRRASRRVGSLLRAVAALAALFVPVYLVAVGAVPWVRQLAPAEQALAFSQFIADAPPGVVLALLVGTIGVAFVVWMAVCAMCSAFGSLTGFVRRCGRPMRRSS